MRVLHNGKMIEMPDIEPREIKITESDYPFFVAMKIHEKYSVDDEIAILRQKEEKPEEYAEYFAYCEKVKEEVRGMITPSENPSTAEAVPLPLGKGGDAEAVDEGSNI